MEECLLYADPALYDRMFPAAAAASALFDEVRRGRLMASERFYLEEAQRSGGPVLELACGSGRLTIPIAGLGLNVTGVDLSATMLEAARAKAAAAGVRVEFIRGDMRSFDLPQRFATILIPGNSLVHLLSVQELKQCFQNVRRHLAAGGRLMFDISHPDLALLERDPTKRYPVFSWQDPERGTVSLEEITSYDAGTNVRDVRWFFSCEGKPDFKVFDYRLRFIFPDELLRILAETGFLVEERYGELTRAPFTATSPRQVCICSGAEASTG